MSTFEALYRDHCNCGCDTAIWPGDECAYVDDEIVLASHAEVGKFDQPVVTCKSCWVTKPCFCEEPT